MIKICKYRKVKI